MVSGKLVKDSVCPRAFIEIRLVEVVWPGDIHIVEACYLHGFVSIRVRNLIFPPTHLHCGDHESAVEA